MMYEFKFSFSLKINVNMGCFNYVEEKTQKNETGLFKKLYMGGNVIFNLTLT
jgi:hypothetical protein